MRLRTFAAAVAALAMGCSSGTTSVQWYSLCVPPADVSCGFASPTCDKTFVGNAVVDPAETSTLVLFAEMHNQRPDNTDGTIGRTNSAVAYVQELDVTYSGSVALAGETLSVTATLPPAGSNIVPIALSSLAAASGLTVGQAAIAHVVARGTFGDGGTFETSPFDIPVVACSGCTDQACPVGTALLGYCPSPGQIPSTIVCQ